MRWPGETLRFLGTVGLFAALLLVLDHMVGAVTLPLVYRYRPTNFGDMSVVVQRQLAVAAYQADLRLGDKAVFVGSSSVINDLDMALVQRTWAQKNLELHPVKDGMTQLLAGELPLLRRYLMRRDVKVIVYLYNTFSFADGLQPHYPPTRWNTLEFLRIARPSQVAAAPIFIAKGLLGEVFYAVRYQDLLKYLLAATVNHTLTENHWDFDYAADDALPLQVPRPPKLRSTPGHTDWNRFMFTTSDTDAETLGYRGLRRFLEVSKAAGIRVIVMPVPEPDFALDSGYKEGIHVDRIDRHVASICNTVGAVYRPRQDIRFIESNDRLFRDFEHLHRSGREVYSVWLSTYLEPYLHDQ